jgi:hypothetical protein
MMGKPSEGCPVWKSTAEHRLLLGARQEVRHSTVQLFWIRDADNTKSLSAAQIIATIVEQVDHRSAEKATKMISDLSNLQPVLKPHLLEKRLEELQEKFDEMDRHGVVHPKEYKLIDLMM